MIATIKGLVTSLEQGVAILEVGGMGFAVFVPANIQLHVGEQKMLYTHLHVRETEITLYGFLSSEERQLFEVLLGVSGVGPKAALSILSTLSVDTLRQAVLNDQPEVLSRAPGVGRKTAHAIALHLKDKIAQQGYAGLQVNEDDADVISALTALGFSIVEAQRALQQLPRTLDLSLDEKIRRTLALLGK
jgi:Holliday junction DNA helicase RuvA